MVKEKVFYYSCSEMIILKQLLKEDMYGYQLGEVISEQSDGVFRMKAGVLYPILYKMEKAGYIEMKEVKTDTRRVRRYCHITEAGRSFYIRRLDKWHIFEKATNTLVG